MRGAHVHVSGQKGQADWPVASRIYRLDCPAHDLVMISFGLFHDFKLGLTAGCCDPEIAHLLLAQIASDGHRGRMAKQLDYHTIREIFGRFHTVEPEPDRSYQDDWFVPSKGQECHENEPDFGR